MTTFSQVVDDLAIHELKRPDLLASISSWLNQTIRDVHSKSQPARSAVLFGENRVEEEFAPSTLPAVWPIPVIQRFQQLEAVYAPQRGVYLEQKNPAVALRASQNPFDRYYWYRSGSNIVFNGVAAEEPLRLTYFQFPPMLLYYKLSERPAVYDLESDEYNVSDSFGGTPAEALALTTHWLLQRHSEALKVGVRHKVYIRMNSLEQAKLVWSDFESTREAIHHLEGE